MSQSVTTLAVEAETTDERTCPECGGDVHPADQESICDECGLVVDEDVLDRGEDWGHFDDPTETRRGGPALTESRHDRGLSTEIDFRDRDANGNQVSSRKRSQLRRLRKWHKRSRFDSKRERNLAEAFGEIDRMATALGMSRDRREQACRLYRSAHEENLILGRCIESIAAASLYAVARIHELPVSLSDIGDVARVDRSRVATNYRLLNRELSLPSPPPNPADRVPALASELDCPDQVRRLAERIAAGYDDVYPAASVAPAGVAAGAVYAASQREGYGRTQEEVADVTNVTVMTIRHRYHELEDVLEEVDDVK
jgi:transcription initiation factor TFIIB